MNSPKVGTSQRRPSIASTMCTGALATKRRIRAAVLSLRAGITTGASATARAHQTSLLKRLMFRASNRDHEQEQEHGDCRAGAEVVDAAECRAPHRERDHVRVRLHRLGREGEHDVENLQDVDEHRHEDDA